MLTIFTPTYNRAYILSNLYESLRKQTDIDFEWIIVDDESTDDTEKLIKSFKNVGQGIRYYKQKHGGKHRAVNLALKYARGKYFFIVDSDDFLIEDAVEKVNTWTSMIGGADTKICGVAGLKIHNDGRIPGGNPKFEKEKYIEATNLEREKYGLLGDKAEVYSVEVLKSHLFPEFEGEYFVTEAVVWDAIAVDGFKLRWYNEPIYVCEYLADGLTKTGANDYIGFSKNPNGFASYVGVEINAVGERRAIGLFMMYTKIAHERKLSVINSCNALNISFCRYCKLSIYAFGVKVKNILKRKLKL